MVESRVRVFGERRWWFFRWDNILIPTACKVVGPLASKEEAEAERQRFMDAERRKRPWVVFETE